ncbi:MAG: hypothetical protein VZQ47_09845 [Treponema sp.]|nr:hypothetical protein [Treponema sp.]MEE3435845.1 hypothetical protein [Treponema sp.]
MGENLRFVWSMIDRFVLPHVPGGAFYVFCILTIIRFIIRKANDNGEGLKIYVFIMVVFACVLSVWYTRIFIKESELSEMIDKVWKNKSEWLIICSNAIPFSVMDGSNQGHKYMLCACSEEQVCACGCGQTIRAGDKGIEHRFYKDGKVCVEWFCVGMCEGSHGTFS